MTKISLTLALLIFLFTSCSDFNREAKPLFQHLIELYEISLLKCKTTQQVWHTAIYDNKYALCNSNNFEDYYVSDFNIAIYRMEKETNIKDMNIKIQSLVSLAVNDVKIISDKKNESYDKLISLYTYVIELSKMALTPEGSLKSYTNNINKMENEINMLITELKARNPEFIK